MPADWLSNQTRSWDQMGPGWEQATENGVLAVLAGTPLRQAAAQVPMDPADLVAAVELYRAAGHEALEAQADRSGWHQVHIGFTSWSSAEHAATTHLWPQLKRAEAADVVSSWWFTRKGSCWRLRCRPAPATAAADMKARLRRVLDEMQSLGLIVRAPETIYEPETCAFGGLQGMNIAHRLFCADSRNILAYLNRHGPVALPSRRELSILLCSALLRAAGQDWYEQGAIWDRVEQMRPGPSGTAPERIWGLLPAIQRLMAADTEAAAVATNQNRPLAFATDWINAFAEAGAALGTAARDGTLSRGVRDILAHHIIFHWNRLGLPSQTQSILAAVARETVFGQAS